MLDWDKLNKKKNELERTFSRSSGPRVQFWRPHDGDNRVRVLPGWDSEGNFAGQFWREVAQHWQVSEDYKGPILCPKNTPYLSEDDDADCPICDLVDRLKADKSNLAAQQAARKIRAKTAYFLNIVDLDDPVYTAADVASYTKDRPDADVPFSVGDPKVQIYAAPTSVFNSIIGTIQVNEVDITDAEVGHDITIKKTGSGLTTRYEVTVMMKPSKAPEVKELPALDKVGNLMEYGEMLNLLTEGIGAEFAQLLPSPGSGTPTKSLKAPTDSSGDTEAPSPDASAEALKAAMKAALNS